MVRFFIPRLHCFAPRYNHSTQLVVCLRRVSDRYPVAAMVWVRTPWARGEHARVVEPIGVTDNAVRLHLTALERDGMARATGVRREGAVGKPATLYGVSPEAEAAFSKAYEPVLTTLLVTLGGRLDQRELSDLLRDVGRQLAATTVSSGSSLEQRVRAAAGVLDALGADTEVEQGSGGGFVVRGFGCPLSRSVAQCPPLCGAVEELVAGITKAKVQERCDRSSTPRCTFLVTPRVRRKP